MKIIKSMSFGTLFLQTMTLSATNSAVVKPNIILIMTDQQSYNMISALSNYYPQNKCYVQTPNIDRLVKRGISFTNTYCANPVSVPSRFALFTGMFGGQYNIRENTLPNVQPEALSVISNSGMGNIFSKNGYETVYSGKVHLPYAKGNIATTTWGKPQNYGFNTYLTKDERDGLAITDSAYIATRTSTQPLLMVVSLINPHDICREAESTTGPIKIWGTDTLVVQSIEAMRAEVASYDSVFFYNNMAPSLPVNLESTINFPSTFIPEPSSFWYNLPDYYWRKYRWIYSRLTNQVDSLIGNVLNAIDNSPMKNNTIIIFTSDHGEMQGAHHATQKNLPYEECQRVPLIISGKGIVTNQVDGSLVCNGTDLIPTICELAGITAPTGLPGISLAKRALGTGTVYQRQHLYTEGDGFSQIIENPNYKYTRFELTEGINEMLIDLKNDPGEMVNVAKSNPDYVAKTTELSLILNQTLNKNTEVQGINQDKLEIFPNPVKNTLTINLNDPVKNIKIYNIAGVDMSGFIFNTSLQNDRTVLELAQLPKGIYFLRINQYSAKFSVN